MTAPFDLAALEKLEALHAECPYQDPPLLFALHDAFPAVVKALREAFKKIESLETQLEFVSNLHDVAVKERNYERVQLKGLVKERDDAREESSKQGNEITQLRIENKSLREREIPQYRINQAMTGYVGDLRLLVLEHQWVTDGRECTVYCLWCKNPESGGHKADCEMFGPEGLIPINSKTGRPAAKHNVRNETGCQCQWEAGDSPCRVHGKESE